MAVKEDSKGWVVGEGYNLKDMQSKVYMGTLSFVRKSGSFHIYRLNGVKGQNSPNDGMLLATYNNQPVIRNYIKSNAEGVFMIGLFEAYSDYYGYTVDGKFVKTIARIKTLIKGDKNSKRELSADPAGIIIVK